MLLSICKEFILSGKKTNHLHENTDLLKSLVLIKKLTLIDDKNANLSKIERKNIIGFTLPYMANFEYIMKHINNERLYDIINDAFIKVENNNLNFKDKIALRKENINFNIGKGVAFEKNIVIKKIDELTLGHDILIKLLFELDSINEDQIDLLEDFLNNGVFELYIEYEKNKQDEFELKRRTIFKGDMPISVNNSIIFDKTFIVEQWIRRIIMFILMTEHGAGWIKAFKDKDLEQYESMRRKLSGKEVIDHKDDNLLWYANISYLANFIRKKDIKLRIESVTNNNANSISKAIFKVGDIRNEMAHNRTITKVMEGDYSNNFDFLQRVILNFKKNTMHSNDGEIVSEFKSGSNQHPEFIKYFSKLDIEQYNQNGTHSFIKEEKYHYSLVLLPSKAFSGEFIDIRILLERNYEYKDYIVAFYVNKNGGEYQVVVSKKIGAERLVYKRILDVFFGIVETIGTDLPYELQDSKYTCNPKIWFYENVYNHESIESLW